MSTTDSTIDSMTASPSANPSRGRPPPRRVHPPLYTTYMWIRRPLDYWDAVSARHGGTFVMKLPGMEPLVVFSNPEDVKQVFADHGDAMHAGEFNRVLAPFLGEKSVLMLDGKEHLRHRRLLLPPFHGERMQAYGREMIDLTRREIEPWRAGDTLSVHEPMQHITLKVIVRTIFGVEEGPRFDAFVDRLTELTELAAWPPLLFPFMQVDLGAWSPWGRFQRKAADVDAAILSEIRRRRHEGAGDRADVLSLLVSAKDETGVGMSDDELRDELVTLLVAGHETTATALAWAFRWILDTPEVERRLTEEILGAAEGGLTPERVIKLEYLDAVVREVLRLQPVIPLVGRILQERMTLGGFDLPAGTPIACSIYLAHRRPEVYPEPARFRPERFLGTKFTPAELFPFGGGIRRCIGMAFALYEMKMVLAEVIRGARLELAGDGPVKVTRRSITLTPSGGTRVRVLERR